MRGYQLNLRRPNKGYGIKKTKNDNFKVSKVHLILAVVYLFYLTPQLGPAHLILFL